MADGQTCTARAENEDFFALEIAAALFRHITEAEIIGVIAEKSAVGAADNGVYAADLFRSFGTLRTAVKGFDFIGNRNIERIQSLV